MATNEGWLQLNDEYNDEIKTMKTKRRGKFLSINQRIRKLEINQKKLFKYLRKQKRTKKGSGQFNKMNNRINQIVNQLGLKI